MSDDPASRPGGPRDPYRQVTGPVHFPKGSFSGKRPSIPVEHRETGEEEVPMKPHPRFKMRFPESEGGSSEDAKKSWHDGKGPGEKTSSQGAKSADSNAAKAWHQGKIPHKTSSQGAKSSMGNASKAWHQGGIPSPRSVGQAKGAMGNPGKAWHQGKVTGASGPETGKVMTKPGTVAGQPGDVNYRESLVSTVLERMKKKKSAIKMSKGNTGATCAKTPGSVGYTREDAMRLAALEDDAPVQEAKKMGGGMKGMNAKKMLNTIAKKPGAVSHGRK